MKQIAHAIIISLPFLLAPAAFAHDPAEHAQEVGAAGAGPDCAAMKNMDMSTMDMNDPVVQAMHRKCMKSMPMSDKKPADDRTAPAAPAKSAPVAGDHGSQR
ncbi:MAG: hypothetical protein ACOY9J_13270 [Pseudomonadota bacterium]